MCFHVPTFSEFDVPLVVMFRFIHYSMWDRSYVSDALKLRKVSPNQFYICFTFCKLFFTIMKDNLFLQYRLRFFCTNLPQEVNLIKFSSHKSAEHNRSLRVTLESHCTITDSWKSSLKLLKCKYSYHQTLVSSVWKMVAEFNLTSFYNNFILIPLCSVRYL